MTRLCEQGFLDETFWTRFLEHDFWTRRFLGRHFLNYIFGRDFWTRLFLDEKTCRGSEQFGKLNKPLHTPGHQGSSYCIRKTVLLMETPWNGQGGLLESNSHRWQIVWWSILIQCVARSICTQSFYEQLFFRSKGLYLGHIKQARDCWIDCNHYYIIKVKIMWEGHKISKNVSQKFDTTE